MRSVKSRLNCKANSCASCRKAHTSASAKRSHTRWDVRIIAATNRDLQQEVDDGRFREDLYYRLNVFPIEVAPLRRRKEDIAELASRFLEQTCKKMNRPQPRLTKTVVAAMQRYDWPGNVRELQNLIERAVITSPGSTLRFELPSADPESTQKHQPVEPREQPILTEAQLKELERSNIVRALEAANGKVSGPDGAASLLCVKPSTLTSRIKKMGIRWVVQ